MALKVVLDLASDLELLERFRREVTLLQGIEHPNLVRVLDVNLAPPRPYAAFDLVGGGTLRARVERDGPLSWPRAVGLVSEIAAGVAVCHERGLLHRDIKPDNVLLGASGAKLADFGLIKDLHQKSLTATGVTLGTPAYMAPEQVGSEKSRLGPPTDVYGLAATLYYALTGKPPFQGAKAVAILRAVCQDPPPAPRGLVPDVPEWLDAVCVRGLAKLGQDRYRDALTFRAALLHGAEGSGAQRKRSGLPLRVGLGLGLAGALVAWIALGDRLTEPALPTDAPLAESPSFLDPVDRLEALLAESEQELRAGRYAEALALSDRAIDRDRRSALGYRLRGEAKLRLRRKAAALVDFERTIELDPHDPASYLGRGEAQLELMRTTEALADFERALELKPKDSRSHAMLALAKARRGRPHEALQSIERALELNPGEALAYAVRGRVRTELKESSKAIFADFDRAIELDPRNADFYAGRALLRAVLGQLPAALVDFDRAIELDPRRPRAYLGRAAVYKRLARYQEELEDYDRALESGLAAKFVKPTKRAREEAAAKLVELLLAQAEEALRAGSYDAAIAALDGALERDPQNAHAWRQRGEAKLGLTRYESALEDFGRAIEQDPRASASYLGRGRAHLNLERSAEALVDFERAVELNPDGSSGHVWQARAKAHLGRFREVLQDLDRVFELDPRDAMAHALRGQINQTLGKSPETVLADYDRAIELDPDNASYYAGRGMQLRQFGQTAAALRDLDRAIELDPRRPRVFLVRALVYQSLGRHQEALADFDHALDLDLPAELVEDVKRKREQAQARLRDP